MLGFIEYTYVFVFSTAVLTNIHFYFNCFDDLSYCCKRGRCPLDRHEVSDQLAKTEKRLVNVENCLPSLRAPGRHAGMVFEQGLATGQNADGVVFDREIVAEPLR